MRFLRIARISELLLTLYACIMTKWNDLRHITLFRRRYETKRGQSRSHWEKVSKDYNNFKKRVDNTDYHWYVITFKDGHKELAYFRVWRVAYPREGRLCRGIIFPHYWSPAQYENTKEIRLAF